MTTDSEVTAPPSEQVLWPVAPEAYGPNYQGHLLEQYRLYVEMADRISSRRGLSNSFLLAVNALVASGFGILTSVTEASAQAWAVALPIAGLIVCAAWGILIVRYRQLNDAKFQVIHGIEKRLPAALYVAEWEALGQGSRAKAQGKKPKYQPLTYVEGVIPAVFAGLYLGLLGASLFEVVR